MVCRSFWTEKLKLNLPEGSDPLDQNPLNENMKILERTLFQHREEAAGLVGAGGHTARIAFGQYVGTGEGTSPAITVDFKPMVVLVAGSKLVTPMLRPLTMAEDPAHLSTNYHYLAVTWGKNSVSWSKVYPESDGLNGAGTTYHWVAIGYDDTAEETAGEG